MDRATYGLSNDSRNSRFISLNINRRHRRQCPQGGGRGSKFNGGAGGNVTGFVHDSRYHSANALGGSGVPIADMRIPAFRDPRLVSAFRALEGQGAVRVGLTPTAAATTRAAAV